MNKKFHISELSVNSCLQSKHIYLLVGQTFLPAILADPYALLPINGNNAT